MGLIESIHNINNDEDAYALLNNIAWYFDF